MLHYVMISSLNLLVLLGEKNSQHDHFSFFFSFLFSFLDRIDDIREDDYLPEHQVKKICNLRILCTKK